MVERWPFKPMAVGSIPTEGACKNLPVSLGGQDTRLSPERPGFNSRTGNFFLFSFYQNFVGKKKTYNTYDSRVVPHHSTR